MSFSTYYRPLIAFLAGLAVAALYFKPALLDLLLPESAVANDGLYAPRNWRRAAPSPLNISLFTFSDRNRSGRYDVGDQPLANVAVRLRRPGGAMHLARSNVNGFANFAMQLGGDDVSVSTPGADYEFEVLVPPEWRVTSDNSRQKVRFRAVAGSISGLGAEQPPAAVGLAPPPRIFLSLPDSDAGTSLTLTASLLADMPASPDAIEGMPKAGELAITAAPGTWRTRLHSDTGTLWDREVQLRYAPVQLSRQPPAPEDTAQAPVPSTAVRVDFDDQQRSYIEKLPNGYAGLSWDYLLAVDNQFYEGPGYVNGLTSGANVAYNSSGHPVTIRADGADGRFDFVGAFFAAAWPEAEGETLIVTAWRDLQEVARDTITLSHLTPLYFQADYQDISRLELRTEHYWQFVTDDMDFRLR